MGQTKKICVLEDDPDVSSSLSHLLQSRGFEVVVFNQCFKAYEALQALGPRASEKPGMLLVDNIMPDQMGTDFCRKLRNLDDYKHTPIVLMSGHDASGQLELRAQKDFGCNGFLAKPFEPNQLVAMLEGLYPQEKQAPKPIVQHDPLETIPLQGEVSANGLDIAQILSYLYQEKFTGVFRLQHHELTKTIYLEKGEVVFADSNAASDQVHQLALQKGWVTQEQIKDAMVLVHGKQEQLGETLLQLGLIKPHQLFELYEEQVKNIIYSTFLLEEAGFESVENKTLPPQAMRLKLPFPSLLRESISMACDEEHLMMRLGRGQWSLCPSETFRKGVEQLNLGPQERRVASLADGTKTVEKILEESTLPEFEALQVIYSLFCLGFLKRASHLAVFVP